MVIVSVWPLVVTVPPVVNVKVTVPVVELYDDAVALPLIVSDVGKEYPSLGSKSISIVIVFNAVEVLKVFVNF